MQRALFYIVQKAVLDPDDIFFFSIEAFSSCPRHFFCGQIRVSTCKLSQENPEISAEYFVFSVQLFLKSRRKERNSKHSAST